jgi:hypothetical protein
MFTMGHFHHGFGTTLKVDCWIYTENLLPDFNRCIRQFRQAGGWTKHEGDLRIHYDAIQNSSKTHDNHSPHKPCEMYYDNATRKGIVATHDAAVYNVFGYTGCCGGFVP